jgi:hypothetical protein
VGVGWDDMIIICVYVDDLTIAAKQLSAIEKLKGELSGRFKMTDLGEVGYILKMQIHRNRAEKSLTISQEAYIKELMERFKIHGESIFYTPQDCSLELKPETQMSQEAIYAQPFEYRELVGSLQYLVRGTRSDIANAVRELSKFMTSYNRQHWLAARRVLRYLKHTSTYGLHLSTDESCKLQQVLYTDASFGNSAEERKSISGYAILFANACISARSAKQDCVSLSTNQAEMISVSEGCRESEWIRMLLNELGLNQKGPVTVFCDNMSTINTIKNPINHKATKHIEIRHLFARELQEKQHINIQYCRTDDMVADIFTKALPRKQFEKLRELLGIVDLNTVHNSWNKGSPDGRHPSQDKRVRWEC